jgi:hypothetical protein
MNCQHVFNLVSLFGSINKVSLPSHQQLTQQVKILQGPMGVSAFVDMGEPTAARTVVENLSGVEAFGQRLQARSVILCVL